VDWSKVDASLAAALEGADAGDRLEVFVHHRDDVRTATVTPAEVDDLSHDAGVRRLTLARRLRLLDDP
jgi:hypothetical protein